MIRNPRKIQQSSFLILVLSLLFYSSCIEKEEVNRGVFRLSENGVTCICENVVAGDKGFINGVEYEAVDNDLIRQRRGGDMTKLCTSLVTDLRNMFAENNSFNQPIGNWDVSNVVTMEGMFGATPFNQSLEFWDVSKVVDMYAMFANSSFNQPINNWNVKNVRNMRGLFAASEFNQPINNWDVSNVLSMFNMFSYNYVFNQPLDQWDVSNVLNMDLMFLDTSFNQNLSGWCVPFITSEPKDFSNNSSLTEMNKPKWGKCPF